MKKLFCLLLILMLCIGCCSCTQENTAATDAPIDSKLKVHFIDVSQGDCILLESAGEFVLVDTGERDYSADVIQYLRYHGVEKLDYAIATHPHSDHIGGMRDVINEFTTERFITRETDTDTYTWTKLLKAVKNKGIEYIDAKVGDSYTFGEATFTIMAPVSDGYEGYNDYSVVTKVVCGEISFLLTGDAEHISENEMLDAGEDLTADVLKCGHHGSSDATSSRFLQAVDPMFAVASCGENNEYGHPHKETIERLSMIDCPLFRTDTMGTIVAETDGEHLQISTERSDDKGSFTAGGQRHDTSALNPIGNKNSMYFHDPLCEGVSTMNPKNKVALSSREEALEQGYKPCPSCNP